MKKRNSSQLVTKGFLKAELRKFATKNDLQTMSKELRTEFKSDMQTMSKELRTEFKSDMQTLSKELKSDMQIMSKELRAEFKSDMQLMKKEFIESVQVFNENLVHDFRGIFGDRTEVLKDKVYNHEGRIERIERHLRFAA